MLTSTQVHQMTVAMFGAAAGGYTEELQAFESLTSLGDFLATLDLATAKFEDATTELAQARIIAGDFGLADNDEAVQQVVEWLLAGESLGTIYAAAIDYLTGTPAADFVAAADAFTASVEGAVAFSAANPEETDVDALVAGVAATEANLALTAALDALAAADTAVEDNIDAWGAAQTPEDTTPTSGEIYDALDAAEGAVSTALQALGASANANLNVDEAATAAGYDASDATEAAAVVIAEAEIAAEQVAFDAARAAEVKALNDYVTTDEAGELQGLVDAWVAADEAATDAADAETEAYDVADATLNVVAVDTAFNSYYVYLATDTVAVEGVIMNIYDNAAGDDIDVAYDAATGEFSYYEYDTDTPFTDADVIAELEAAMVDAGLVDAIMAYLDAAEASDDADTALTNATTDLTDAETVAGDLYNAGALAGIAATYAAGVVATEDRADLTADLADARADLAEAKAAADALAALEDAAADALEAVTDADTGLGITLVADAADFAGDDEVFIFAGDNDADLDGFGTAGLDRIYFGSDEYTLVKLGADDVVGTDPVGDVNALEIFWEEVAGDLVLYVELETFGGNAAGLDNVAEVTLSGVAAADITFADNYMSAGA